MKNICDRNNCKEIANYKAPVEKDNSKKYRMLCLEHVKEFNKNWNYFSGMDDEQIMDFLKSDMIWHKPTQSFGSSDTFFKVLVKKFHPDMNSGNKKYEEKLKLITLAYTQLKNTYRKKNDT